MNLKKVLILTVSIFLLFGCGGNEADDDSGSIDLNSSIPSTGDSGGAAGEINTEIFSVSVTAGDSSVLTHRDGSATPGCEFDKNLEPGSPNNYLNCIAEIQEGSAFQKSLSININAPPKLCHYISFNNYHYYNFEVGRGPTSLTIREFVDDEGNPAGAPQCSENGGALGSCSNAALVEARLNETEFVCEYNHGEITNEFFPNCCYGTYSLTNETFDVTAGVLADSSTVQSDWGTTDPQCYGGPAARDADWPKNPTSNRPFLSVVYESWQGYNTPYTIQSPSSLTAGRDNVISNMTIFTGARPIALDGYNDLSGNPIPGLPTDNYIVSCLDEAFEVVHSVHLDTREWNTASEYLSFSAGNLGANPNVTGTEGTDCAYEVNSNSNLPSYGCNDFHDWDSLPRDFPQSLWE